MRALLAVLVACAYALVAAALLGNAFPAWIPAALLLAIATIVTLGTFFPNLGVFIDVVRRGPEGARGVALTFDDGPHPEHTRKVLDLCDEAGVKATFFVIGEKVERHPEVVREIVRRGHDLGLHSSTHDRLLNMRYEPNIVADLRRNQEVIERVTGLRPRLFRPPVGLTSPRTRVAVRQLGLVLIGWSARAYDGAGRPSIERVLARIAPRLAHGVIVLLHDAPERGDEAPSSLEALPQLLGAMRDRGLSGVTVSSLLAAGGESEALAQQA